MKNQTAIVRTLMQELHQLTRSFPSEIASWPPIPWFGNLNESKVATVGINPSNKEFVDNEGLELSSHSRRFPTLGALGLECWKSAEIDITEALVQSYNTYFQRNPYDIWFKPLDNIIKSIGASYYTRNGLSACHLDLVPFATINKWSSTHSSIRSRLLKNSKEAFASTVATSNLKVLILNGTSVINTFVELSGLALHRTQADGWKLRRGPSKAVNGWAYEGTISEIGGLDLGREIRIFGYNHNIQSSFGVTREARVSISDWLSEKCDYVSV